MGGPDPCCPMSKGPEGPSLFGPGPPPNGPECIKGFGC